MSKGTERLGGPSHTDYEEGNPRARTEDRAWMLWVYSNRDAERTVVTPVRSMEESGIFKWGDLSRICYRDHIQWAGFGETNWASTHGEPLSFESPWLSKRKERGLYSPARDVCRQGLWSKDTVRRGDPTERDAGGLISHFPGFFVCQCLLLAKHTWKSEDKAIHWYSLERSASQGMEWTGKGREWS